MLNSEQYKKLDDKIKGFYAQNENDIWRNGFHITMPFGLMNDPNGLCYYNNKFHIFYQWNPLGCEHKNKHWGLVATTDFIKFTKPKIVLKPKDWFDKDGCYSGCGLVKDTQLMLYYTGNVKKADGERESYQCLALYDHTGGVEKKGVLIAKQPEGYTSHFRDPYVFLRDKIYYMVVGGQTQELEGKALLYKSTDSLKWETIGELKTGLCDFGYMWECPNLVEVSEDKTAFIFSPQGLEAEKLKNQNDYQSGYVIGDLDLEKTELKDHSDFKELDMGFDFYAPQVFRHKNENIMLGWAGMPDKERDYPTGEQGWMYSLTMPRVLEYRGGLLYQKPFEAIKNLRKKLEAALKDLSCKVYHLHLDSRSKEIEIDLEIMKTDILEFRFKFAEEYILLTYEKEKGVCTINRDNMILGGRGIRKFKLQTSEALKMHIYIDRSIMEIYYEDGLEVTTFMYFPEVEYLDIEIESNDRFKIKELKMWDLRDILYQKDMGLIKTNKGV